MTFDYLGFRIEYNRFIKKWLVIDWDYEIPEGWQIGPPHKTKYAAMQWCENQGV